MKFPWAVPGQKVICIDGDWYNASWPTAHLDMVMPELNRVYTIRQVIDDPIHRTCSGESLYFRFVEIVNKEYKDHYGEVAFGIDSFRPIIKRQTDISILQKILLSASKKVSTPEKIS
jgi:hypothetical protein